ncbi:uncharacterized protein BYT42DRAFT_543394 [Radiomyces spectabilis]|uniref:uncharacterized protein n=1 Tax=Radiomyces spectabilis TaxID=64574 RepID=UPI0022207AB9|nr:uncharacterized protein BYT42DRAFT_543394 [Radiomyces spectabilis]KAI8388021.1 hypothetical protein BYT42DRAFT_543394 [Radiomyces spectabilis]
MLKYSLALLAVFASTAFACEPECRRGLAADFTVQYEPVVRMTLDNLQSELSKSLSNFTFPDQIRSVVPEDEFRNGIGSAVKNTLEQYSQLAAGQRLEKDIYNVMFNEDKPFKGDCNHPKRVDRRMPPPGDSWTRDECVKMDYICGNPPSICHFLDDIKGRIVKRMKERMQADASYDNGWLVRSLLQDLRYSVNNSLNKYGAGSMVEDPSVNNIVKSLVNNSLRSLDAWVDSDVKSLCTTSSEHDVCDGWDEVIIPKILQWP